MRPSFHHLALAVLLTANAADAGAGATAWADPTRPAGILAAEGSASAPRVARAAAPASAAAPAIPQLQSVQVGTNGSATALVDGRLLQVGDTLGGSRIVAIDAEGLTLRNAQGRNERLSLISSSIAKRDGGPERPMAALTEPRPAGRQGQRP
jgi:hypothetical protein